ncbi:MAG: hypothetical protein HOQ47_19625, partial [Streptomyces sp.]|nr:hypothetical protein [Streptomyces sp.]
MSQNRPRTDAPPASPASAHPGSPVHPVSPGSSASHTGRRRHAAPARPNWTRRAGLVGGVVSAIALSGAAAPAIADNHGSTSHDDAGSRTARTSYGTPLSTAVTAQQASAAVRLDAIAVSLAAAREEAAQQAAQEAAAAKRKADAAAKAAKARATATALA